MEQNQAQSRNRSEELETDFMAYAVQTSKMSNDPNTKVGAVIVNQEDKIVAVGYNAMPNGCNFPWYPTPEYPTYSKYPFVCHAVLNAFINKNIADLKGCTLYTTLFPCHECAKLIIQAGLKDIVFLSVYRDANAMTASKLLLDTAGINQREFQSTTNTFTIDFGSIKK